MSYVSKITDTSGNTGLVGSSLYGTCTTGASTAAKVAVIEGFDTLIEGVTVHIKFTNSNTATTPTLSIKSSSSATSGTTAKNIYKYGTTKPGTTAATSWQAGSVVSFTYDGSYWQMNDHLDDTNTHVVASVNGKIGAVTLSASDVGALASSTTYAGSSTAGGSATSAAKLDTATAGSATQPCYFSSGVPSACTYSLNKTVPSDAVFTDTNNAVTQTATDSTNSDYEILFSGTADNTTRTEGARKTQYLKYNPYDKQISITKPSETSGSSTRGDIHTYIDPLYTEIGYYTGSSGSSNYSIFTSKSTAESMTISKQYHTSSSTSDYEKIKTQAKNIIGSYGSTDKFKLEVPNNSGSSYSGSLLLTNGQSSPTSLTANNTDITLAGSSNTWDGTNTSLKSAVTGAKGTVTQTILSADNNNDYHFILSKSADINTETNSVNKAQSLTYNEKSGEVAGATSYRIATTDYHVLLQPGELFISDLGNSTSVDVTAADIVLSGTGNTWDGNHTSLKGALTPQVVSDSTVNLNNYTSSGKFILTGSISTKTNFPVLTPGQLEVTQWTESSSSYFCRQEFKVYDKSYRFQNDSFTRMGTSSNGTTWDWGPWGSDQYFVAGETFTLGSGYSMYGHITSTTTRIYIYTVLPKSLRYVNITKPTSTISMDIRQNGKYVQANPYSFTVDSLSKFGDAQQPCGIEIGLKNANGIALTNGTNNDTVSAQLRANLTLSFTARTL